MTHAIAALSGLARHALAFIPDIFATPAAERLPVPVPVPVPVRVDDRRRACNLSNGN